MKVQVLKKKFTKKMLNKIIEIDKTFYADFDYSDTSWYFTRYSEKNIVYVLVVNDEIVGYFNLLNVSKKLFDDIYCLRYSQDYNFPESDVNVESDYLYMPSMVVRKEYRKYSMPLILMLKEVIKKSRNLIVIAISNEGKKLASICLEKVGSKGRSTIFAKREEKK